MSNKAFIHTKTGNIVTPKGRLLWNALFNQRKPKGDIPGKYEFNMMVDKNADLSVMKEAALEAGKEKFAKAFKDAAGKWPSGIKNPFKKTADQSQTAEYADEYPVIIAARSPDRPGVVGADGKAEGVEPSMVYAGRWVRATLQAYAYDKNGNRGVTFGLVNVQLLDDDEELVIGGGRVSAESEFEDATSGAAAGGSSDSMFE